MGQAQQKRRAVMIVEDDAELRSLTDLEPPRLRYKGDD